MPGGFPPISPGESGLPSTGKTKWQEVRTLFAAAAQSSSRDLPQSSDCVRCQLPPGGSLGMGRTCRRLAVHRSHGDGGRAPPQSLRRQLPPKGGWAIPAARAALWQRRAHLALRPAPQRLPLNKQGSNAANLQRIASAEGGNSGDPLQPEPPRVAAARATNKDGAGVRGNRHSIPPAAFRRFRRAKAASQAAGKTSDKRCEYLCSCAFVWHARAPSVIGLRPLTAPSRREPWNGPGAARWTRYIPTVRKSSRATVLFVYEPQDLHPGR